MTVRTEVPPKNFGTERIVAKEALLACTIIALPALFETPREFSALGLALLVFVPLLLSSVRSGRLIVSDPGIIVGVMWFLAASAPVLMSDSYVDPIWYRLAPWALDNGALWMYRGWATFSVVYWGCRTLLVPRVSADPAGGQSSTEGKLRLLIGALGLIGSLWYIVLTGGQNYSHLEGFSGDQSSGLQVAQLIRQFSLVYIFLYFQAGGQGRLALRDRQMIWSTFAALVMISMMSSSKGAVLQICASWLLGSVAGTSRPNLLREFAVGSVALIVISLVFYFVTAYRYELSQLPINPNATFGQAVSLQGEALQAAFLDMLGGHISLDDRQQYGVSSMLDRLGLLAGFATVLEYTGGTPPYETAIDSFLSPLYAVLPRDFLDSKAHFFDSTDLAQLLGWKFGGFSPTLPGSLYWAWGYEGIIVGMAAFAIALVFMSSRGASNGAKGLIWQSLMVKLVLGLLDVGMTFQAIVIGEVRSWLFLLVLLFVARNWKDPERKRLVAAVSGRRTLGDSLHHPEQKT